MFGLPGPVFEFERVAAARRGRYYAVRAAHGLVLLWLVGSKYWSAFGAGLRPQSHGRLAEFSSDVFLWLMFTQLVVVLALTPGLVAGAIADERGRGTLLYLLSSRLGPGQIVLGKLAARMLHVAAALALAVPILGLLGLFGGVDPAMAALGTLAILASGSVAAGFAMLVSVVSRRSRDAVAMAYLATAAWLLGPELVPAALASWFARALPWATLALPLEPLNALFQPSAVGLPRLARAVAVQFGLGAAFSLAAMALLRPMARRSGESAWRPGRLVPLRSAPGDDPMLWKELRFGRHRGALAVMLRLAMAIAAVYLAFETSELAKPSFAAVSRMGYGRAGIYESQDILNRFLRKALAWSFVAWVAALAGSASASIAGERDGDTWTSLVATPLEAAAILRAKALGALWRVGGLAAAQLLLAGVGLAAGAIHPLGFAAWLLIWSSATAYVLALGTWASLRMRSATRATVAAFVALLGTNLVIPGALLAAGLGLAVPVAGCTPGLIFAAPASYPEVGAMVTMRGETPAELSQMWQFAWAIALGVLAHSLAALCLGLSCVAGFDAAIDRPRRPAGVDPSPRPLEEGDEDEGRDVADPVRDVARPART